MFFLILERKCEREQLHTLAQMCRGHLFGKVFAGGHAHGEGACADTVLCVASGGRGRRTRPETSACEAFRERTLMRARTARRRQMAATLYG